MVAPGVELPAVDKLRAEDLAADGETLTPSSGSGSEPSPTSLGAATEVKPAVASAAVPGDCGLLEQAARVKREVEARNVRMARLAAALSLVVEGAAAAVGLGVGFHQNSLSLIGFGVESFLDGLASAFVLWRFKTPKARQHESEQAAARFKELRDAKREMNSGFGIGVTFVFTAMLLYVSAAYKLVTPVAPHEGKAEGEVNLGLIVSLPLGVIVGGMAVWKLRLGKALKSQVLWKDGLCSVLGAALALICAVAAILEEVSDNPEDIAKVDAVASALIATILLFEGCRTVKHNLQDIWAAAAAAEAPTTTV